MNESEIKKIMDEISIKNGEAIRQTVDNAIKDFSKGLVTAEQLSNEISGLVSKKDLEALVTAVEKQGMLLNEINNRKPAEQEDIKTILSKRADEIRNLAFKKGENVRVAFKANVLRSSITDSTIAQREPGIGQLPTLAPQLLNLFSQAQVGPGSNGVVRYIDQDTVTRAAAPVAEAGLKPEGAVTWIEKLMRIETIAEWLPVSKQALEDLDFLASELDQLLRLNLSLAIDQQLYSGSGVSPQLRGVYTAAPAYVPVAGLTTNANIYDLIAAVATDISNNADANYLPDVALVNPLDALRMKLRKATDGHYVMPAFSTPDGRTIDGMRVIPTARVASNTLLVGDFRYGRVYTAGDIEVTFGLQNQQFVQNMVTMLAEIRLGLLIRDVNLSAFRKVTDIAAALTGIG